MTERFTPEELFILRNNIPIRLIITAVLKLRHHSHDATFRFECPLCHGYDTATNPTTNLARCFVCKKNFNPIDLCMTVRALSFRQAVSFLRAVRRKLSHIQAPHLDNLPQQHNKPSSAHSADLTRIGDILARYTLTARPPR